MKRMITEGTKPIFREEKFNFNAPHNYVVYDNENNREPVAAIHFQEGPVTEVGHNGVTEKELLLIIKERIEHFQKSEFSCEENEKCLKHINKAIESIDERTNKRVKRNVEGTSKK